MFYVSGQVSHEQSEAMCCAEGIELEEDKEEISKEIVKMQRVNEFEFELREDDIVVDVRVLATSFYKA